MNDLKDDLDFDAVSEDDDDLSLDEAPADSEPKASRRSPELERKIRAAVERMLEAAENPYEAVIVAAQEARRINARRLKARSIIHQAMEQIDELVTDVPLVPKTIGDEEPEVKPTNEALEHFALGQVTYEVGGETKTPPTFAPGLDLAALSGEETEED
jgi:DNA-directed RNA polymerase subunit K/omega